MARRGTPGLTAGDRAALAEQVRSAGVPDEPVLEDILEERRQRYAPRRSGRLHPLVLANQHGARSDVHVRDECPQDLTPPGSRVGGEADSRVNPRVSGVLADVAEEFLHLAGPKVQTFPERVAIVATGDLSFDFLAG